MLWRRHTTKDPGIPGAGNRPLGREADVTGPGARVTWHHQWGYRHHGMSRAWNAAAGDAYRWRDPPGFRDWATFFAHESYGLMGVSPIGAGTQNIEQYGLPERAADSLQGLIAFGLGQSAWTMIQPGHQTLLTPEQVTALNAAAQGNFNPPATPEGPGGILP